MVSSALSPSDQLRQQLEDLGNEIDVSGESPPPVPEKQSIVTTSVHELTSIDNQSKSSTGLILDKGDHSVLQPGSNISQSNGNMDSFSLKNASPTSSSSPRKKLFAWFGKSSPGTRTTFGEASTPSGPAIIRVYDEISAPIPTSASSEDIRAEKRARELDLSTNEVPAAPAPSINIQAELDRFNSARRRLHRPASYAGGFPHPFVPEMELYSSQENLAEHVFPMPEQSNRISNAHTTPESSPFPMPTPTTPAQPLATSTTTNALPMTPTTATQGTSHRCVVCLRTPTNQGADQSRRMPCCSQTVCTSCLAQIYEDPDGKWKTWTRRAASQVPGPYQQHLQAQHGQVNPMLYPYWHPAWGPPPHLYPPPGMYPPFQTLPGKDPTSDAVVANKDSPDTRVVLKKSKTGRWRFLIRLLLTILAIGCTAFLIVAYSVILFLLEST